MTYDRYVTICNPLMYPVIMNNILCIQLAAASLIIGIQVTIGLIYKIFTSPFSKSNELNHFLCDVSPLVQLCCGDTFMIETLIYVFATVIIAVPFGLVLGSYGKIISTIMKLPSATVRAKAFSTCSSHLMVVTLFFGSGIIVYMEPTSTHSSGMDKYSSLLYSIFIPLFNSIIYCPRNRDVTAAMGKFLQKWTVP
ncbi:olfactory receptor 10AG1-like [Talpa occidentalis]|uniref:olfactory receptor 10AG1-like n=1 Tax=Talpa occidentalis TaxID=50954 RepID=UPI00188E684D|nr:olfactory receptor 10AG1-like [Talpa occidentalis]